MAKVVAVVLGRLGSTRMPRKILANIEGRTMIERCVERCERAQNVVSTVAAVPDHQVEEIFNYTGLAAIGGPESDTLSRMCIAALQTDADYVVRVTADCPLVDPTLIDYMVDSALKRKGDIITNTYTRTFPNGLDCEVYSTRMLLDLSECLANPDDREWFAQWSVENLDPEHFRSITASRNMSHFRVTVDYPEDLEVVRAVYRAMGKQTWDCTKICSWLRSHPKIARRNDVYADDTGKRPKKK